VGQQKGSQIFVTQRLHQYDLSAVFLETGKNGRIIFAFPGDFAPADTRIPLIGGRSYFLEKDEILHPGTRTALKCVDGGEGQYGNAGFQATGIAGIAFR